MPVKNYCSNPLKKAKYKCVFKNIRLVTENWSEVYKPLIGKYICNSCRIVFEKSYENIGTPQIEIDSVVKDLDTDLVGSSNMLTLIFYFFFQNKSGKNFKALIAYFPKSKPFFL